MSFLNNKNTVLGILLVMIQRQEGRPLVITAKELGEVGPVFVEEEWDPELNGGTLTIRKSQTSEAQQKLNADLDKLLKLVEDALGLKPATPRDAKKPSVH